VPLHSEPTEVGALGGQEYPPTRRCHSPAGNAPEQLPASGMWNDPNSNPDLLYSKCTRRNIAMTFGIHRVPKK